MTHLLIAFAALLSFAGGDDCCQAAKNAVAKNDVAARAKAAIESWKTLPQRLQALSAEDQKQLASAQAVTDRICPVCKELPATLAFLKDAFAADDAAQAKLFAACHGAGAQAEAGAEECPYLAAQSDAIKAPAPSPALELITVALAANAPKAECCAKGTPAAKSDDCCAAKSAVAGGGDDCCAAAKPAASDPLVQVNGLLERAKAVEATWTTSVPAALAAMTAADKTDLTAALATHKKLNPRMAAMLETMSVLRELAGSGECCAEGASHATQGEKAASSDAMKAVQPLVTARADLKKKTAAILASMAQVCGGANSSCCAKDKDTAAN